jgi:hypothetical protein
VTDEQVLKKEEEKPEKSEESVELVYDSEFEKVKDQYVELQEVFKNFTAIADHKNEEVVLGVGWNV